MKKIVLLFVSIITIGATLSAQNKEAAVADVKVQRATSLLQMATAAKEAGATDQETGKLKIAFEAFFKKQDEIRADSNLTADEKKKKFADANATKDWKVKNILGDKFAAYAVIRKTLSAKAAPKKD